MALEDGRPFVLEPFQRAMLTDYFGGTTETLVLVSKKNGKSTLLSALALHHLITTPDAECVIAAASRDQAEILFGQAAGFVRRFPDLQERVTPTRRELRSLRDSGRVRVLASDVDTADGVIPTLALVDELHRHKSADLYGVFRDGLGPRAGRMITISTAGADPASPLAVMRRNATALAGMKRDGAYRFVRSGDGSFAMHEWALDPDQDLNDLGLVKQANPASWQTVEALQRRRDSPSMTQWQWARFACGVWTSGEEPWLPDGAWEACRDPGAVIPEGTPVWLGVDVGLKKDSSAVVVCAPGDDGVTTVRARVFTPRGDGHPMDLVVVENHIRELADRYHVYGVAYDRWSFERSAQMLSDEGLLMIEFPMTNERTVPATERLREAIVIKRVRHDGDPVFAAHVLAGTLRETPDRGARISKGKARAAIDALVALMVGFAQADTGTAAGGGFSW